MLRQMAKIVMKEVELRLQSRALIMEYEQKLAKLGHA